MTSPLLPHLRDLYGTHVTRYFGRNNSLVREPLTDAILQGHLEGRFRVGTYFDPGDGTVILGIIDFDGDPASLKGSVRKAAQVLEELGISSMAFSSKSKGFHLAVYFTDPVPAYAVRKVLSHASRAAGHPDAEVFPKQDRVDVYLPPPGSKESARVGSYINLPFHGHDLPKGRTAILGMGNGLDPDPDQLGALEGVKKNSPESLLSALGEIGQDSMPPASKPAGAIAEKLTEGQRRPMLFSIAGSMRRRGASAEEILAALRVMNRNRCEPPLEDKELEKLATGVERYPAGNVPSPDPSTQNPKIVVLEKMKSRSVLDLLSDTSLEEPQPVLDGIFGLGELMVLGGPPKAMKSWTIKNIGLSLSSGTPWLGFHVPRPYRVIYLSAEGRESRLRARFQTLIGFSKVEEEGLSRMEYVSTMGRIKLDTEPGERTFLRLIDGFEVVILDPYYRFQAEGSENSHEDQRRLQDLFDRVKDTGKAIILVHHVRKPSVVDSGISELRGAGLDGFTDSAIIISRKKEDKDDRFVMRFDVRNYEPIQDMELVREGVVLAPAVRRDPCGISPWDVEKILSQFDELSGTALATQIKDVHKVSRASAERSIAAAEKLGNIAWKPRNGPGQGRLYYVRKQEAQGDE